MSKPNTKKTATVIAVVGAKVNVLMGGNPVPGLSYPSWYAPQPGDVVVVDWLAEQPYVDTCFTPGRVAVVSPVEVLNAAPGAGWDQISAVYAATGINANPALALVRTTPVTGPSTLTVPAKTSRSWDPSNNWRTDDSKVRQGSFGSGENYGLWFYGASAFAALSGHTVTGITMEVTRDSSSGATWGPMQLHCALHDYTVQPSGSGAPTVGATYPPSGADPSLSATVKFALPLTFAQALQAGTQAGIAIASADPDDYVICLGPTRDDPTSGQLVITYT